MGQHLAAVIDDAAANAQNTVAGGIKGQHQAAGRPLIRLETAFRKAEEASGNPGFLQNPPDGLPGGCLRTGIADDEGTADAETAQRLRQAADGAGFDTEKLNRRRVTAAAGTGNPLRGDQRGERQL